MDDIARQQGNDIAELKADFRNVKDDVAEMKEDVKEQGKKIDNLALEWQQFGGLSKMFADVNRRVNILEQYAPMLDEIKKERTDNKFQLRNVFWDVMRAVVIGLVAGAVGLAGLQIL